MCALFVSAVRDGVFGAVARAAARVLRAGGAARARAAFVLERVL